MENIELEHELIGALIALVKTCDIHQKSMDTDKVVVEGLRLVAEECTKQELHSMLEQVRAEKTRIAPDCSRCPNPCDNTKEYDITGIGDVKLELLALAKELARHNQPPVAFLYKALAILSFDLEEDVFKAVVKEGTSLA